MNLRLFVPPSSRLRGWVPAALAALLVAGSEATAAPGPLAFKPAQSFAAGASPSSVAVGDVNRDGKPDLAVANAGSNNVSVLLGNGDGSFQTAVNFAAGAGPFSVAVGDVNGDGKPDLVTANENSHNVSVLLGNDDGSFQTTVDFAVGDAPHSVAVGDVNGDGKPDLVTANADSNNVNVLLGNGGNGTIQVGRTVPFMRATPSIAILLDGSQTI